MGRNGKSTIFRVIEKILDDSCTHEHLEDLSGSKAGSKSTVLKLNKKTVNIAEDQKNIKYINLSLLTRIISGEPIAIDEKKVNNFSSFKPVSKNNNVIVNAYFRPYATMLFSVNEVIDFRGTGKYLTDRFIVIPFNATFTDDNNNRNINIVDELCKPEALKIIATRAIQAFEKVLENGKFTIPDNVKRETERYFIQENHTLEFCNSFKIKTFISKTEYYKRYQNWCYDNFYEPLNNAQFGKQVLALGYRSERFSFDSKRDWYYVNATFDNKKKDDVYQSYTLGREKSSFQDYLWKQIVAEQNAEDEQTIDNEQNTQEAQSTENEETASDNT